MFALVRSASRVRSGPGSVGCAVTQASLRAFPARDWRSRPGCGPLRLNSPTGTHAEAFVSRSFLAGLIGSGIGPSLTPPMHEQEGQELGVRYVYRRFDLDELGLPPEAVGDLLAAARTAGYDGVNVTHPCKQLVIPHLDDLSPDAAARGAVNTVVFADGRAVGHNTDWSGFARAFDRGLPDAPLG